MHISILVSVFLIGIGYALHLVRLRVHEKRMVSRFSENILTLEAEKASAEQRAEELSKLDTIKSQILVGQINGLRTPLMLLTAAVQTQNEDGGRTNEAQNESVSPALQFAQQIKYHLNQISEILELELGNQTLHYRRIDFDAFIGREVMALKPLAERNNITLSFESCKDGVVISLDPVKAGHAINGLLYRAFESTSEGDTIRLYLTKKRVKVFGAIDVRPR